MSVGYILFLLKIEFEVETWFKGRKRLKIYFLFRNSKENVDVILDEIVYSALGPV
jgi:hypothetical protein